MCLFRSNKLTVSYWLVEKPGQVLIELWIKKSLFCPVCSLQSWIQSRPPPRTPTCPSLSSSTAGTSGRTFVCSASPRKSSHTHSFSSAAALSQSFLFCEALYLQTCCSLMLHPQSVSTDSYMFFHSEPEPLFKTCLEIQACLLSVFLPPSDSSLTALVTATALSEVTSEARPPASIGRTCCLCVQGAVPGCCSGRP